MLLAVCGGGCGEREGRKTDERGRGVEGREEEEGEREPHVETKHATYHVEYHLPFKDSYKVVIWLLFT